MSAIDTLRTALFGTPPSPSFEPSRTGVLAAFDELMLTVSAASQGMTAYATVADLPGSATNGTQARVYNDTTDTNNTIWLRKGGAWAIDSDYIDSIVSNFSPLLAEAGYTLNHLALEGVAGVIDDIGFYGSARAVYFPLGARFYDPVRGGLIGTISNSVSSELAGYCKINWPAGNSAKHLIYTATTGVLEAIVYTSLADRFNAAPGQVYVLASRWGDSSINTDLGFRRTDQGVQPNLFHDGKTMDGPDALIGPFGGTPAYTAIAQAPLTALGFSQGWKGSGGFITAIGANVSDAVNARSTFFCRFYVETTEDNEFGSPMIYINGGAIALGATLERVYSARVRSYVMRYEIGATAINSFLAGVNMSGKTAAPTITGLQYYVGKIPVSDIHLQDYPATPAAVDPVGDLANALAARDASNMARAAAFKQPGQVTNLQRPQPGYNLIVTDGQSLAAGQETWPRLSTAAYSGNKMLGGAVSWSNGTGANLLNGTFMTFGAAALNDLIAHVVNEAHDTIISDGTAAALTAGNGASGELPDFGFVNSAKFLLNQQLYTPSDTTRTFVAINTAVSGQNIERFLPGGNGNFYGMWSDAIAKAHTAASATPITAVAHMWWQGQFNYYDPGGLPSVNTTRAGYVTSLNTLINAKRDAYKTETGQTLDPAFYVYQVTGPYTRDNDGSSNPGLAIGMAQLDVANSRADTFLIGPDYPFTDKSGHLDSNGSRWAGCMAAKVFGNVQLQGQRWEPLSPLRVEAIGESIYLDFHTPEPPLVFDNPYVANVATAVANKGFKVTDSDGDVSISAVDLVNQTQVRITLGRAIVGSAFVWYAHQAVGGYGMLRDSDAAVAHDKYVYLAGSGMYASANIAALVNKPYPLQNWCVAFYLPVGYGT